MTLFTSCSFSSAIIFENFSISLEIHEFSFEMGEGIADFQKIADGISRGIVGKISQRILKGVAEETAEQIAEKNP